MAEDESKVAPARRELLTPGYRATLREMYRTMDWGGSGHKRATEVVRFAGKLAAHTLLDYGCGQGNLRKEIVARRLLPGVDCREYDPGIESKSALPEPADLVVCTDVLEHVEPECLDTVIDHISSLARRGAILLIATRPANKNLPDGRNAHLIVESATWWEARVRPRLCMGGWTVSNDSNRQLWVWTWLRTYT